MLATLDKLEGFPKRELKSQLDWLPVGFQSMLEPRKGHIFETTIEDDERFGYFNLEAGFYSVIRSGIYTYEEESSCRRNGYKETHLYLNPSSKYEGVTRSYFMTVENPQEDMSCDCGKYLWDNGSVFERGHGKLIFVRKLLPFEIIDLKFKLFQFSKRKKPNPHSIFRNKDRS